jgi:hypothetical protein
MGLLAPVSLVVLTLLRWRSHTLDFLFVCLFNMGASTCAYNAAEASIAKATAYLWNTPPPVRM